jgi:hypothetical protein
MWALVAALVSGDHSHTFATVRSPHTEARSHIMLQNSFKPLRSIHLVAVTLGLMLASSALAKEKQELPAVDQDGLHLIKDSKVAVAYARPGANLGQYSKVMLLDVYVEFREDWARDYNMDAIGLQGRVADKDVERIKKDLADEFRKVFTETLAKDGHQVVDEAGPDVLLLRPAIVNLDVAAPDTMRSSRGNTWVSSAGSMTLYMEFYDSSTSTLLARVADPKADPEMGAQVANKVTNKAAADRIIRSWAKLLSSHLGEVKQATAE